MKIDRLLRTLGWICFLLIWIPFAMIMYGVITGSSVSENMSGTEFFGEFGLWVGLIVVLSVLMPFFFIGSILIGSFSNRRIISKGLDAEARVLKLTETGTYINNNPVVKFTLEVKPNGHPVFVAETTKTISLIHLPAYQPGQSVQVKYIPETEKVAIIGAKNPIEGRIYS